MKVRILAMITALTALALWYFEPNKREELAATCVSSKAARSKVIAACATLIDDQNTSPEYRHLFLTKRAWAQSCNRNPNQAIADANQALNLQPRNYKTRVLRAKIHAVNGDHQDALADFDSAVAIEPTASYTHWNRARYLDRQGEDEKAFNGYQRALQLNPNASNAMQYLVDHLLDRGQCEHALEIVAQAQERWPDLSWVYERQVHLDIVHTKNLDSALAAAEKAASLSDSRGAKFIFPAAVHLTIGDDLRGIEYVHDYAKDHVMQKKRELSWLRRIERRLRNPSWELHSELSA